MIIFIAGTIIFLVAYLFGSIPTGYLAGMLVKGIDIREHGSFSSGATNALRTLGRWPAAAVLLIDVLKGVAAILFAIWFFSWLSEVQLSSNLSTVDTQTKGSWFVALAGIGALVGHSRSIWLGFAGGKSAATGLGVLLGMSWPIGLGAALVFAISLAASRIVSVSSMSAATAAVALVLALERPLPYRILVCAGALYVIFRHRANIQRLLNGAEPKLGQTSPAKEP
ncbi:MAG: glycerol-3-phosphate 1-O-acyltransferase PlsY [Sulfitobacter sp.]